MSKNFIILVFVFFALSFSQENMSEDILPLPLPIIPETLGVSTPLITSPLESKLREARSLSINGAAVYFVGMGLDLGLVLPLSIVASVDQSEELLVTSMLIGLVVSGFEISGPIRNGVGASMAYDYSRGAGLISERNKNWNFYRSGWIFTVMGTLINFMGGFVTDVNVALPMSFISLGFSVASQAMWITSISSSLKYTREALNNGGVSRIGFGSFRTSDGLSGLKMSLKF